VARGTFVRGVGDALRELGDQQAFVTANFGLHDCTVRRCPGPMLAFETGRGLSAASYDPGGRTAALHIE
jgi:hypothetical protein